MRLHCAVFECLCVCVLRLLDLFRKEDCVETSFNQIDSKKQPLIYSSDYNISFLGLEKLHPFDSCKYAKVVSFLEEDGVVKQKQLIKPIKKPTIIHLLAVHTSAYIISLKQAITVAEVTELSFIAALPQFIVQKHILDPFLYATSGTILAGHVAMQRGWAINIGGGFHHCCYSSGGGFCPYSDITLSYNFVRRFYPKVKKVMIIDLDAHQGNGHENDKLHFEDDNLYILDMFNPSIYPRDEPAKAAINMPIHAYKGIKDKDYLKKLKVGLKLAFEQFTPDFIIYNAGTDILDGDPLGCMSVSPVGVKFRDEMVFGYALKNNIPLIMLLSGGYQQSNGRVIANSIANLNKKYNLIDEFGADGQKIFKTEQCINCGKDFIPDQNTNGDCAHKSTYHAGFEDCNYLKCGFGLGPSGIGYQHWGCCYKRDKNDTVCPKSSYHVAKK